MKGMIVKGLSIGAAVGIAVYAGGLIKDALERQEVKREREVFGTGTE
jgi:hypothetical protein